MGYKIIIHKGRTTRIRPEHQRQQTDGLFKSNANISIKNVLRVVSGQVYYFPRTSGVKSNAKGPIRIKQCPNKISTFLKMNK